MRRLLTALSYLFAGHSVIKYRGVDLYGSPYVRFLFTITDIEVYHSVRRALNLQKGDYIVVSPTPFDDADVWEMGPNWGYSRPGHYDDVWICNKFRKKLGRGVDAETLYVKVLRKEVAHA